MTWKSIVVGLALLLNQMSFVFDMGNYSDRSRGQEKLLGQGPTIKCTIATDRVSWRVKEEPVVVSVEIEVHGKITNSVMPAVHLIALPKKAGIYQDEYWAPFDVKSGKSTGDWQKLGATAEKKSFSVRLVPTELLWASTKSSVWPSDPMVKTVPPGDYSLQVELEVNKHETFTSNEVKITIVK